MSTSETDPYRPLVWVVTPDKDLFQFIFQCLNPEGKETRVKHFQGLSQLDGESQNRPDIFVVEVSIDSEIQLCDVTEVLSNFGSARGLVLCDQDRTGPCRDLVIRGEIRDYFLVRPSLDRDYLQIQLWRTLQEVGDGPELPPVQLEDDIVDLEVLTQTDEIKQSKFSGKKVLVVEDEFISRVMLRDMLIYEGFDVKTASDVHGAVERYAKDRLDIVLLDLFMPGISGAVAVKAIRNHFEDKQVPIVVTSSYSDSETVTDCTREGIQDYIIKPIRQETLFPRLARVLELE